MAEESASPQDISLQRGENDIPSIAMGETGYNGLQVVGGNVLEEYQYELRWPHLIHTLKEMSKDETIAPALTLVETQISRINWSVKIPHGYEEELGEKAEFLRQCMHDMDHTWNEFISQCVSFVRYGFSIHEKVFRYRTKAKGSKYNDGLIAPKRLPIRSQDSLASFEWKNKGRDLKGVWQQVNIPSGEGKLGQIAQPRPLSNMAYGANKVFLRKEKFLHFRTGAVKDSPYGTSPLVACWRPWKYKTSLEEHEMIGVAQDLRGLKVIYIHPKYLDPNASDEDKAVAEYYREIVRSLHSGEQSGLLMPSNFDENGNPMFKFDVVSVLGQKAHDVDRIINRYKTAILTALSADFLILGQGSGGSFALTR